MVSAKACIGSVIPLLWGQTVNVHICVHAWVHLGTRFERTSTECVSHSYS